MLRIVCACLSLLGLALSARADLAGYVKKEDKSFEWKLARNSTSKAGTLYTLALTSQTWQGIVWKHDLVVYVPAGVEPTETMFLWNTGGKAGATGLLMMTELAKRMNAPVAFLYGVPNQPLFEGKREDALIAETFVRYLKTKDGDWPLLFPMVKSVVRAMDALQAFAKQQWKKEVKGFVVSGASKRGWTTWLTGASDPRVKAIAPLVIDTLNMRVQLPHQLKSYGAYSRMIHDYTERKLVPMPDTPEAKKLWGMVDPWLYRAKLKMPKLILNGTNDPYWTQDALNLYWDDLEGPKWVSYVPNAGHGLEEALPDGTKNRDRALDVLGAFGRAMIHGKEMPKLSWVIKEADGATAVAVASDPRPREARLWTATAATRDFRKATWKPTVLEPGKVMTVKLTPPKEGFAVYLVECEYGQDEQRFSLTTQVRILGK